MKTLKLTPRQLKILIEALCHTHADMNMANTSWGKGKLNSLKKVIDKAVDLN